MKKLIFALLFLASCEAPYKITETYTTDSTGKTVKTVQKFYNNSTVVAPSTSINVVGSPLLYPYGYFYSPRIVVPAQPRYYYTPRPSRPIRH